MANKPKAIYEPGELDNVRRRLGDINHAEAKKMASLLGGEIGVERAETPPQIERQERDAVVTLQVKGKDGKRSFTPVDIVASPERGERRRSVAAVPVKKRNPADDPSIPVRHSYLERLKMDRQAALPEFDIKTSAHILYSVFGLFAEPPDLISSSFTSGRMNEYYGRLEALVMSTRALVPASNVKRWERLKKKAPFACLVLSVLRDWPLEKISSSLSQLQSKPREVLASDYKDILRCIYRPLYQLKALDSEIHIKAVYQVLYRELLLENGPEEKARYQGLIRKALTAWPLVRDSVHYLLYPLLLRLNSSNWLAYTELFKKRPRRLEAFLGIVPADVIAAPSDEEFHLLLNPVPEEKEIEPEVEEKPEPEPAPKLTSKAVLRGLETLQQLFPESGWNHPESFPDLHPYFSTLFEMKRGYELIAPNDPMQQVVVLILILEELFYGVRYISFSTLTLPNGEVEKTDHIIDRIITEWHEFIEGSISKEYLPRLVEYCRILDSTAESRTSNYAKKTLSELLWMKKLFFLPHLEFDSVFTAPPFKKQEVVPAFTEVRELKRILTSVAAGIEQGNKAGGAASRAACPGIDNPWDHYVFQVSNPVSVRLDSLLGGRDSNRRTNAALLFFTLSVVTVLDALMNDPASWAYGDGVSEYPFRSVDGDGVKPLFITSSNIDTEGIFQKFLANRPKKGK